MCGRSLPAPGASAWSKRLLHRAPSSVASPDRDCWPMGSSQNMPITALCIARQRSTLARAAILIAPRWQGGQERRHTRPPGEHTPPAVWFAYTPDRKGEHPRQHLKNFKGALQADAYAGFHPLYGSGDIYEVACWAHSRRKFHDIHAIHASPITTEAIARIGALYGIEEDVRGKPAELRCSVRQARARPLLDDLRSWLEKSLRSLSTKSETAGAIRYALSHWRALTRYVDDGLLEIDNSAAERALRAVAIGRKNYLFMGSDCGGERAAAMYSLIGSAKRS